MYWLYFDVYMFLFGFICLVVCLVYKFFRKYLKSNFKSNSKIQESKCGNYITFNDNKLGIDKFHKEKEEKLKLEDCVRLFKMGDYEKLLGTLKILLSKEENKQLIDFVISCGNELFKMKEYDKALNFYLLVENYVKNSSDISIDKKKLLLENIGHCYYYLKNRERARYYYRLLYNLCKNKNKRGMPLPRPYEIHINSFPEPIISEMKRLMNKGRGEITEEELNVLASEICMVLGIKKPKVKFRGAQPRNTNRRGWYRFPSGRIYIYERTQSGKHRHPHSLLKTFIHELTHHYDFQMRFWSNCKERHFKSRDWEFRMKLGFTNRRNPYKKQ